MERAVACAGESRRLWQDVTGALLRHDLDTATAHKRRLEDLQRAYETARKARNETYAGKLFRRLPRSAGGTESDPQQLEGTERWLYKRLPSYVCLTSTEQSGL